MSAGTTVGPSLHMERLRAATRFSAPPRSGTPTSCLRPIVRPTNRDASCLAPVYLSSARITWAAAVRPDYLLILTWDLHDEIVHQGGPIREWGGRFVVPLPELSVLP
jgi:hypothetical protein